jgi:tetratricopeptide (TPR) repeat protein
MSSAGVRWRTLAAVLAVLAAAWLAKAAPAPGNQELRSQVLKLNDVTGDEPIKRKIEALVKDKDQPKVKKLLAVGVELVKDSHDKEPPLNYNALYILARTAQRLGEAGPSETFYRGAARQALELQSASRISQAYSGLIDVLYGSQKYAECEKICNDFVKIRSDDESLELSKAYIKLSLVEVYAKEKKFDEAHKLLDPLLKQDPDDWLLLEYRATVQYEQGKYAVAAKTYENVLDLIAKDKRLNEAEQKKYGREAAAKLIQTYSREEKYAEARRVVDNLLKDQPDNWEILSTKALLQSQEGKYADAAKTYDAVLARINADKALSEEERKDYAAQVRYRLSNVYVELNQIDKVTEVLEGLIAQDPDFPGYNNDLGYIWADHDMNLDKAEKLIREALAQDRKRRKENPNLKPEDDHDSGVYLDSLGWVLYKQKKYEEAKKALLDAVSDKKEGQNIEIYDHLGEVYKALGDKAKAIDAWKKGIASVGKDSTKRDRQKKVEVEKKLKENK